MAASSRPHPSRRQREHAPTHAREPPRRPVIEHRATRWESHHPAERAMLCGGWLLIALLSTQPAAAAVVLAATTGGALVAGLPLRRWCRWLALPVGFVATSILPFALATAAPSTGATTDPTWWSADGLRHGAALGARALAAASALILFAATTPVHRCALLLRRLGVPSLLTDAVLLTARLQQVVRERFVARGRAARLRHGDVSWSARWRTSALLGAGLLLDTAHRAERLERGLALRGGFSTEQVVSGGWQPLATHRLFLVCAAIAATAWLAHAAVDGAP